MSRLDCDLPAAREIARRILELTDNARSDEHVKIEVIDYTGRRDGVVNTGLTDGHVIHSETSVDAQYRLHRHPPDRDKRDLIIEILHDRNPSADAILNHLHQHGWKVVPK